MGSGGCDNFRHRRSRVGRQKRGIWEESKRPHSARSYGGVGVFQCNQCREPTHDALEFG